MEGWLAEEDTNRISYGGKKRKGVPGEGFSRGGLGEKGGKQSKL